MNDQAASAREAEATLLGAVVANGELATEVFAIAQPVHFLVFGGLAKLLGEMNAERAEIDYVTVRARANGHQAELDTVTELYANSNALAMPAMVRQWASEIRKHARRTDLRSRLVKAMDRLNAETDLTRAEQYIADTLLAAQVGTENGHRLESIKDIAINHVGEFAQRFVNPSETWGLPTGFRDLDKWTGGLEDESLYLIAARPSVGKTALMLNLANHIAVSGEPVVIFSLEMSSTQLLTRLTCLRGGFNSYAVRQGLLNGAAWSDEMRGRFFDEYDRVSDLPIWVDDAGGITTRETRNRLAGFLREHQARVVFFDYINLAGNKGENRNIEVGAVARGLKEIAKEFHLPVVALCQLSRKTESTDTKEPELSHLRDSGELEQVAQVILFLHRQDYINRGVMGYTPDHKCKVIIAKNQSGEVGHVFLRFDESLTKFEDEDDKPGTRCAKPMAYTNRQND